MHALSSSRRQTVTLAIVAIVLALAAFVPIRTATTHLFGPQDVAAACNSLRVYEDAGSGGSDGNDSWSNCTDRANLNNFSNNLLLGCNDSLPPPETDWSDCISKLSWSFTGTTEACLWPDVDYKGGGLRILPGTSNTIDLSSTFNDKFSSIEVSNVNCSPGGAQRVAGEKWIAAEVGNGKVKYLAP